MATTFRQDDGTQTTVLSRGEGRGFAIDLFVYGRDVSSLPVESARALHEALGRALEHIDRLQAKHEAECTHATLKPIRLHDAGGIMVDGAQCRECDLVWKGNGPR